MNLNLISPYIRRTMYSTLTAGCVIKPRVIYDYEIIFVKGGKCRVNIDGKNYICKENNVIFIRPGIVHSFYCDRNCDFIQPHIHFDLMYDDKSHLRTISFKEKSEMSEDELILIQDDLLKDEGIPFVFTPDDISAFQKIFFSVIDSFINGGSDNLLFCKSEMLKLMDTIFNQFGIQKKSFEKDMDLIFSVKDYIDKNYMGHISLELLSEQFNMNKFTMMRSFKMAFGDNIIGYCNNKKIVKACELLENTNLSVRSIGDMLGYYDAYSFSRFFKKIKGIPPKTYQMQAQKLGIGKDGVEKTVL